MSFKFVIERNDGSTTVLTQERPETVTDKLNRLARECGFDNISPNAIHIIREVDQPTGVTVIFNRNIDDSFTLERPVAARIAHYRSEIQNPVPADFTGLVAIKRIVVGYSALARINTAVEMQRVMGPLINEAIKDFIDTFGFISVGYKITALRPGLDESVYFRDVDDAAAMEFRLCLIKE